MNPPTEPTDEQMIQAGEKLAALFCLKEAKNQNRQPYKPKRYLTEWGTKTALGLYLSARRIIRETEPQPQP